MKGEKEFFRKRFFGGFNREDVIKYIAKIADERNEALAAKEKAEQDSRALADEVKKLRGEAGEIITDADVKKIVEDNIAAKETDVAEVAEDVEIAEVVETPEVADVAEVVEVAEADAAAEADITEENADVEVKPEIESRVAANERIMAERAAAVAAAKTAETEAVGEDAKAAAAYQHAI